MKFVIHNNSIIRACDLRSVPYIFNCTIAHKALHTNFRKGLVYKILKNPRKLFLLQEKKENLLKVFTAICELKKYDHVKKCKTDYHLSVAYLKSIQFEDKKVSFLSNVLLHDVDAIARVKREDPFGFAYLQKKLKNKTELLTQLKDAFVYFQRNSQKIYTRYTKSNTVPVRVSYRPNKYQELAYFHHFFCEYQESAIDYSFFSSEYIRMLDCIKQNVCDDIINIPETYYPEVKLWNSYVRNEKIVLSPKLLRTQFTTANQKNVYKFIRTKLKPCTK